VEESTIAALPVDDVPVNLKELEEALEVEGAREIASGFLEDVASVPDRLTNSLKLRDKDGVRSAAHLLKGCCLIIFARKTAELASEMEKLSIASNFDECDHLLPKLLDSLNRTIDCLEKYLDES
jgi:HPt (histidine-containing phosphotransfer) domain-containing protein